MVIHSYNEIAKLRCRIFEVGISYYGRTYEEGKKSAGAMASQCCTPSSSMVVGDECIQIRPRHRQARCLLTSLDENPF